MRYTFGSSIWRVVSRCFRGWTNPLQRLIISSRGPLLPLLVQESVVGAVSAANEAAAAL
jgi:hypothetical protein